MSYKEIFTQIYEGYKFGGTNESRSGLGSTLEETNILRDKIKLLIREKNIKSVVDVPCGDFNWMKEIVFSFENYIGGDIVSQCIIENNERYSNSRIKFIDFDLLTDEIPTADLLIVRDIVGHFPLEDGKKIINNILKCNCKYLLSTTWHNIQDEHYNHKHFNKGVEDYGKFYSVNLMSEPFFFPKPDTFIVEDVDVVDYKNGNRKVLALWDLQKVKDHLIASQPAESPNSNLTVITGLWNINRTGRPFDHYIENFKKFLDIPQNLFIFIPKEYEHLVWSKRSRKNTFVKIYELDDIKTLYSPFWDKTQQIRTNPDWYNSTGEEGWLKHSPQAVNEWYNPIVMSKMFMMHDVTLWNPFNTDYFIWLDAGITNTVYEKYFTEYDVLNNIYKYLDPFLFLSYPYEANEEIHGFKFDKINEYCEETAKWVCRGGLFGGTKEFIHEANGLYYSLLERSLSSGLMGTEESIFLIMSYLQPEKYRRYALDDNGLIVKFIQALHEGNVELEAIPEHRLQYLLPPKPQKQYKTSLYVLTFNFPQQLQTLLDSYEKHPEWLITPRKILIDNSNDENAVAANKIIADKYEFEHIVTGKNGGICGGRQLAAEHFHESDSDYYIFLEDDMCIHEPSMEGKFCRNGFKHYIPGLYNTIHKIMIKEGFDFLKLSYTEVYMDNNIQVSWYNVPQTVRSEIWPDYDKLPVNGLDPNAPRTQFKNIEVLENLSYASGEIYYANWPMIVSKKGNQKMFIDTKWAHPFEQTWMSHMFQETRKGNLNPAVLLAAPVNHNRIVWYKPEERREN